MPVTALLCVMTVAAYKIKTGGSNPINGAVTASRKKKKRTDTDGIVRSGKQTGADDTRTVGDALKRDKDRKEAAGLATIGG